MSYFFGPSLSVICPDFLWYLSSEFFKRFINRTNLQKFAPASEPWNILTDQLDRFNCKRCSEEIASTKEEMARMFSHFEGKLKVLDTWMYFLLALLFARYSSFYLCLFLFSFAFLSPYSAYFGVLSNFFGRFSRLALRNYFLFFLVSQSLSFHPVFTQNPLSTNLNHNNFLSLTKL